MPGPVSVRAALLLLCAVPISWGQSSSNLSGVVYDPSGAILAGVQAVCRNQETGVARTTQTNDAGIFRCTDLPIGAYEVTLTHSGFQTLRQQNVELLTARAVDLSLTMRLGQVSDSVEVTAETPLVQTAASSVQSSVTERQMQELPLNGRNPLHVAALKRLPIPGREH